MLAKSGNKSLSWLFFFKKYIKNYDIILLGGEYHSDKTRDFNSEIEGIKQKYIKTEEDTYMILKK